MKRIKPVVLKDATKLTNSEMKKIRGGAEQGYSQTCSAVCYTSTGAMLGSFELSCKNNYYCDIVLGEPQTTLGCFPVEQYNDPTAVPKDKKTCLDEYENYI